MLYDAPPSFEELEDFKNKNSENKLEIQQKNTLINGNKDVVINVGTALYQWKARTEGEMSFGRNDVIEILEQAEMRWRGRLQKNPEIQGWFPKSYIKLITNEGIF